MDGRLDSSLRTRLILAVILTTLPLLLAIWYGAQRRFERESQALEAEVERQTAFIAGDVSHLLEATRQLLVAVSGITRAASPAQASVMLNDLAERCPYYTSFGVVQDAAAGTARSGPFAGRPTEPIDEQLVRRAAATRQLVVGKYRTTAAGGEDSLSVAYCPEGASHAGSSTVAFVVLDLRWLDALLAQDRVTGRRSLFPAGMILNIVDGSGTILTRYPDKGAWTGKTLPDTRVLEEILHKGEGAADLTGVDGQSRFYAFQSVQAAPGDIVVCTGVSRDAALAEERRTMHRSLSGVAAAGLLLILGAWFGTGLFITRPVAALVDAARRLGAGDLAARTGVTRGPREIAHLAGAFDRMAETLEREARERERLRAKLVAYDRQLRSMATEAALAEEQERKQIAAGLHDRIGPLLATCYMQLGRAAKLASPPEVPAILSETRAHIDQAIGELRSLTFDLSSPALYTLGLTAAVEALCRETAKHHALAIAFQDRGTPKDLTNDQRVILYRAARELLFNVVKHAEATRATVTCGGDAEEVFVSVADDGVGFDAAEAGRGFSRTGGFGLFNLRERVAHLGGRFAVESSRGAGTRAVVALPVLADDERTEAEHGDPGLPG